MHSTTSCRLIKEGSAGTERSNMTCSQPDEVFLIHELITPYYRDIVKEIPGPAPHRNYSTYHLFCLKKNISSMIRFLNKEYSVVLSSKENGDIMSVVVEIYHGNKYVKLNDEENKYIEKAIQDAVALYPKCLIYDMDINDIKYQGKHHKKWLVDILTDIYVKKPNYKIMDNKIYCLNLVEKMNHDQVWNKKYLKIEEILEECYNRGIIYLRSGKGKDGFIKAWNMVQYSSGKNLYYPDWRINIVNDKVSFLYDKMIGNYTFVYYDGRKGVGWRKVTLKNYNDILVTVIN